ncbi:MAG: MFS transporter [Oscillospiraceae bacterium]|nr:MFS transporter [Oscillospiraceae bacterium]
MKRKNGRAFLLGIFSVMFVGAVCATTQGVLLSEYIAYYHLYSYQQGLMSSFQSAGSLAALFLAGVLAGRMEKSRVLVLTAVGIPIIFFLFGTRPLFALLLAGYGVYGILFGFMDSLGSSIMVDLYPEKSAFYVNLLHGIYGIGGLAGPVLLSLLAKAGLAWQQRLLAVGCLSLVAAVLYLRGEHALSGAGRAGARPAAEKKIRGGDIRAFVSEKGKRGLLICSFLYGAHQIGITTWITRYLSEYLKSPAYGAVALSVFWVTVAAARLVVPRLGLLPRQVIFAGHLIAGAAVLAGVLSGSGLVMLAMTGVSGFAEGTILPMTLDIACHWSMEKTSLGSSMVLIAHYAGFMAAPLLIGFLIARCSVAAGMLIPAVLSLAAAAVFRTQCWQTVRHTESGPPAGEQL